MNRGRLSKVYVLLAVLLIVITAACCTGGGGDEDVVMGSGTGNTATDKQELLNDMKPVLSDLGGYYTDSLSVSISLPAALQDSDLMIRYTLNGSEPTAGSNRYDGKNFVFPDNNAVSTSFGIDGKECKVTILRAACFDSEYNRVGKIATATYIQTETEDRFDLPVVCIVTDPINLSSSQSGIFTNWNGHGREWERPAHIQFIEANSELVISQDAGIRLFGGSSRGLSQRSFRITARQTEDFGTDRYDGAGKFKHELFPGRTDASGNAMVEYDSFILRNGGNDSLLTPTDATRATFIRDGIAHVIATAAAPEVDNMNYRPVVVFLNGEYYGMLNMREHENDNMIRNVYGIEDKENICVISSELDASRGDRYDGVWFYYEQDDGPEGELGAFYTLMQQILAGELSYDAVSERIDLDNFMKYCAVELFLCNTDWPHNNVKLWRYCGTVGSGVRDGKWRFMLKDMDLGMGRYICGMTEGFPIELYTRADSQNFRLMLCNYIEFTDMFSGYPNITENRYPDSLFLQGLMDFCMRNSAWRASFTEYCRELAVEIWPVDKLETLINDSKNAINAEMLCYMNKQFGAWPFDITTTHVSWTDAISGGDSLISWARERSGAEGEFMKQVRETAALYEGLVG